ncbi:MAG TPA: VWA domain-containing protein [Vicinamibacterales bacterium]|jgi:Ca-activated chloride channel family protein|nr:VWA domain-containing protein [Vicinamibacterales bacterium]
MPSRRTFLASLAAGGMGTALIGPRRLQASAMRDQLRSSELFHAGAELVPTAATVRDGEGRLVTSLQREDFTVSESGTEQPITQFTRERVPLNLALILDVSDSMRGPRMDDARLAVKTFLEELLKPEDEAALLVFNHATRVLSNWTTDREPLLAALADARPTGGTAIYDAVNTAIPLFRDRPHPRAAMVLVSDGADTASDTTVIDLKQRLSRGDVFLYGVAIDTPNARSSQRINPQVFRELSAQSGGYAEVIGSTADIGPAMARIAEELNAQYMLGYTPVTPGDGRFRSIRVSVSKGLGYIVRARRGVVR